MRSRTPGCAACRSSPRSSPTQSETLWKHERAKRAPHVGGGRGGGRMTVPGQRHGLDLVPVTGEKSSKKEYTSDQEVRWCPGCGDYAILAAVQSFLPELGLKREYIVSISGIGCAARFPYYLNTYGIHSIPGRPPAIATGLAPARPELSARG